MLRFFVVLVGFFFALGGMAQEGQITIGERKTIYSEILGEDRPFIVGIPPNYDENKKYSLLFVLDGDYHFISTYGVVEYLSKRFLIPDMIVVAIPNTNRVRDLTPTHTLINFQGEQDSSLLQSGGGEQFLRFIEEELIAYMDSNYSLSNLEVLVGHSWGGLIATHGFFDRDGAIDKFIAIDPSYWWDQQYFPQLASRYDFGAFPDRRKLFISASSLDIEEQQGPCCLHRNSIDLFYATLKNQMFSSDRFSLSYFEDEDHASVPVPSLYYGLKAVFSDYKLENPNEQDPYEIERHYESYAKENNAQLLPSEDLIRNVGLYQQYAEEDLQAAKELYEYNYTSYPNSWKACYTLGALLLELNEKERAKALLQKSITINPYAEEVKQLLKQLE
ncbi:MAG: alpha/beta hydrolase-fold protein [Bacteroidota bacterium]